MKYTGNVLPEITKEEHDQNLNAKRVSLVSASTIYAVVNTGSAGQASVVLDTGDSWIGLATVVQGNSIPAGTNYIGLATVVQGNAIPAGTNYIGLVSAASINGTVELTTSKTLSHVAIAANSSGTATIFVPTDTFKVTSLLLSANATVGVRIKSGATYLTGNASVNMTLFPGGGFAESGTLEAPIYIGATSGDAFVVDLDDSVEIAGKVIYFEE